MNKKTLIWSTLGLVILALVGVWIFLQTPRGQKQKVAASGARKSQKLPAAAEPYLPPRDALPGQPAVVAAPALPVAQLRPEERSPLADKLNLPDQPVATDLAIVYNLLDAYRRAYGAFPTGEDNAQIVNALSGTNKKKLAFLDRQSPAINARGELIDRWGSPFFFHILSSQEVDVRSAGPDREFYTADDAIRARADKL